MNKIIFILDYLKELYPEPICELNYQKDYELLIAVVLSAQATDKRVNQVTALLFNKYPTLKQLAKASYDDIKNIIKPVGMYRKKALFVKEIASTLDEKYNGLVPNKREDLESLPGVGRKGANVVLSLLFNVPCIAVDTHVARVAKRLSFAKSSDNVRVIEKKLSKVIPKDVLGDMHYRIVLFGRYNCKSLKPNCLGCKLKDVCKYEKKDS